MREIETSCRPGLRGLSATCAVLILLTGCAGQPPADLGSAADGLAPCPESPNCVSSLAGGPGHRVDPLRLDAAPEQAADAVVATIEAWPRARVTLREAGYVRSEFASRLFGFVDDVEFWWAPDRTLHVRSASRLGYSDLGVNRKRVEALRTAIRERLP